MTIFKIQAKQLRETKKNRRYCLLNSRVSKLKGKNHKGKRKTNKKRQYLIILLQKSPILKVED